MKLRKILSAVVISAMMLSLFAVPAFAANVDLGAMMARNNDTQMGWCTDGLDGKTSHLSADDFRNAKFLVLELAQAPTGGLQIIWQGDGDGWGWNQTDDVIPEGGTTETTIVIDLEKTLKKYNLFVASEAMKIFLGYYDTTVADLQVTKAYFTDTAPAAAGGNDTATPAPAPNPATGDNNIVIIAIAALAVTGTAAFVLLRKKAAVK